MENVFFWWDGYENINNVSSNGGSIHLHSTEPGKWLSDEQKNKIIQRYPCRISLPYCGYETIWWEGRWEPFLLKEFDEFLNQIGIKTVPGFIRQGGTHKRPLESHPIP